MPLSSVIAAAACLTLVMLMAEGLLALKRANSADLGVIHAEFAGIVQNGMNV